MSTPPLATTDEHSQAFWRATEAALEVNDRYQFFVWLRLHLHRFIPHDLALCMLGSHADAGKDGAHVQVFHSVPVIDTLLRDFPNARSRWWRDVGEQWQRQGRRAVEVGQAGEPSRHVRRGAFVNPLTSDRSRCRRRPPRTTAPCPGPASVHTLDPSRGFHAG